MLKQITKKISITLATLLFIAGGVFAGTNTTGTVNDEAWKVPTIQVDNTPLSHSTWKKTVSVKSGDLLSFNLHYFFDDYNQGKNVKFLMTNLNNKVFDAGSSKIVSGTVSSTNRTNKSGSVKVNFTEKVKLELYNVSWQKWPCQSVGCETALPDNYTKVLTSGLNIGTVKGDDSHYAGNLVVSFKVTKVDTPAPVNGGWTDWSVDHYGSYGSCVNGEKTRNVYYVRSCTNPAPANGGANCSGASTKTETETATCSTPTPDQEAEVFTRPASHITDTCATLNGRIEMNDDDEEDVYFSLISRGVAKTIYVKEMDEDGRFSKRVCDLNPGTAYAFVATTDHAEGAPMFFNTTSTPTPTQVEARVYTRNATNIGTYSAQLNGYIDINDTKNGKVYFVYGPNRSMTNKTSYLAVNSNTAFQAITGLTPNTKYYFQAIIKDNNGIVDKGVVKSFRTKSRTIVATNGKCSQTRINKCIAGRFVNLKDTTSYNKWMCTGYNGGKTAVCYVKKTTKKTTKKPVVVSKPMTVVLNNQTTSTIKNYEEKGLEINKWVGKSRTGVFGVETSAKAGDTVFYKIKVKNNSDKIVAVKVEDFIPEELNDKDGTTADSDRYMTWVLNMQPGQTKTFIKELVVGDEVSEGETIDSAAKITVDDITEDTNSVAINIVDGKVAAEENPNRNTASIFGASSSFFPTGIIGWLATLLLGLAVLLLGTKIFTTISTKD